MRIERSAIALAAASLTVSCAPRLVPPAPVPILPPAPRPPAPAPPPAPTPADWSVGPLSPGDWSADREGPAPTAFFGPAGAPAFAIRCAPGGQIGLARLGAGVSGPITIRTSFGARILPAAGQPGQAPAQAVAQAVATLAASDPLLDQIVFSRGRFLVQAPGVPDLIVPAWPEAARVIEQCRG